jgi:hypothetical protein
MEFSPKKYRSSTYFVRLSSATAVRLKVEENQLVGVVGEIGVRVVGLKGA